MSTTPLERLPLIDQVEARLNAIGDPGGPIHVYVSRPEGVPTGPDGHVARYAVIHLGYGTPTAELDLADTVVDADQTLQITCVGAWPLDCYRVAELVDGRLFRWRPAKSDGTHYGRLRTPPGFDPGPARFDDSTDPGRYWLPLQYQITANRT